MGMEHVQIIYNASLIPVSEETEGRKCGYEEPRTLV